MIHKVKKVYSRYKKGASKSISIAAILAIVSGILDLFNERAKEKDTTSKLWIRISELQKENSDLDKRTYLLEHGVSIYQTDKSLYLNNVKN